MATPEQTTYRRLMASADLLERANVEDSPEYQEVIEELQVVVPAVFGTQKETNENHTEPVADQ